MKSIETAYRGYRFRSRLEARWAVFFDALSIRWQYEPEGFDMGEDGRYLPDFFLPGFSCNPGLYVEVKPYPGIFGKARRFAELSGHSVLLLTGPPDFINYHLLETVQDFPRIVLATWAVYFIEDRNYQRETYVRLFTDSEEEHLKPVEPVYCGEGVIRAVHASRAVRFEFGDAPSLA
jgi:hypothetical protein